MKNNKDRKDEFRRHKSEIESEYQSKLIAMFTLYPEFKPMPITAQAEGGKRRGTVPMLVRQVINKHSQTFTLDDIAKWISEADPESAKRITRVQLSNTLSRFMRMKKLERLSDTETTTYKKVGNVI